LGFSAAVMCRSEAFFWIISSKRARRLNVIQQSP
jgi:hypothetical protein